MIMAEHFAAQVLPWTKIPKQEPWKVFLLLFQQGSATKGHIHKSTQTRKFGVSTVLGHPKMTNHATVNGAIRSCCPLPPLHAVCACRSSNQSFGLVAGVGASERPRVYYKRDFSAVHDIPAKEKGNQSYESRKSVTSHPRDLHRIAWFSCFNCGAG